MDGAYRSGRNCRYRRKKQKGFGKITGGFGSLYGITNYLSDVLSYSRLLALGLATGVVAKVVNILGSLAGSGVVGIIVFIAVFLFGTVFNLAINALGAYVHSCRLQYVEFFGKFYTGGGKPFEPFVGKTKFVKIVNKEENDMVETLLGGVFSMFGSCFAAGLAGIGSAVGVGSRSGSGRRCFWDPNKFSKSSCAPGSSRYTGYLRTLYCFHYNG